MDISVLGVDLGKNVCSVVGLDASGAVVMRRKVRRETLIALAEKLAPCVVGMEACCGAHHLGRVFAAHGYDVRLMSPEYVRPYVKAQKNDDRDAEGIAEAATRPTMRFVELKSQDQLDMQTLHRSRDRLVGERTALINQLRAILLERGMVAPQGKRKLEQFLSVLMDEQDGAGLSLRMIVLVADARKQWAELDRRISAFDAEFVRWVKENEEARRLITIPGIGAIVASALVAAVGQAESFERGRDLAAWLGLVPRQFTTGGKPKVLGISKRGEVARPTLRFRGLLGLAEPILIAGGRAVADYREAFVGIDVAKLRNAIAIADAGRDGEVRFLGEVDASGSSMGRVVDRIAAKFDRAHFCYEAGPYGYGLYRARRGWPRV